MKNKSVIKPRNSTLSAQVLKRDKGICQCCGYPKADEVHHIHPVVFGGMATLENLITLCSECHRLAPNDPDNFLDYQRSGGAVWQRMAGVLLLQSVNDPEEKDDPISELWEAIVMMRLLAFEESYRMRK